MGRGWLWGLASAIGYTAANIFLRASTSVDAAWVSAVKSVWIFLLLGPWLAVLAWRGTRVLPDRGALLGLILAGMIGQFGGNLAFQESLEHVGISIAVPVCLGTMIAASALVERIRGGEPLRRNVLAAIPIFLVAIVMLSIGRASQTDAVREATGSSQSAGIEPRVLWGCVEAGLSGVAYSILGFAVRRATRSPIPVAVPMVVIGMVGTLGLGPIGWQRIGWEGVRAIEGWDWAMMSLAGVANAAAFLALSISLKSASVLTVHLINCSQVAMAAVAGLILFGERVDTLVSWGVALTVAGFLAMAYDPNWRRRQGGSMVKKEAV